MNDFVRSVVFLTGIAAGIAAGFASGGGKDGYDSRSIAEHTTTEHNKSGLHSCAGAGSSFATVAETATPEAKRLENVLAHYAARAEAVRPGEAEALVLEFRREADFWQLPALIYVAAERDPNGCWRALIRLENINRCNSSCWEALFRPWVVSDPQTALQRLLDLPDANRRRDLVSKIFQALKSADGKAWETIVASHGREIVQSVPRAGDAPQGVNVQPERERENANYPHWREAEKEMSSLETGSAAARRLAAHAAPGTLTPVDFLHAAGNADPEKLTEQMTWLAGQSQPAARLALLELSSRFKGTSLSLMADGELRDAVIRNIAVNQAGFIDYNGRYKEWMRGLSPADRATAEGALLMDATLSVQAQAAALRMLREAGK